MPTPGSDYSSVDEAKAGLEAVIVDECDRNNYLLHDPTGTVNLGNPAAIESAIHDILRGLYGNGYDADLLSAAIRNLISAYCGGYPGLLTSDTLYHDLRHALETGLTAARLLDGYTKSLDPEAASEVDGHHGLLCVLLAMYHDIGLLRNEDEADRVGAAFIPVHEERGARFMGRYLADSMPIECAEKARLIMATKFSFSIPDDWSSLDVLLATIVGSADLLSQFSDRCYLEKCRDFLFVEFRACGQAGTSDSPFPDWESLLAETPKFLSRVIYQRLDHEFRGVYRWMENHTRNGNPWHEAIQRNLRFLEDILSCHDFSNLRRTPLTIN